MSDSSSKKTRKKGKVNLFPDIQFVEGFDYTKDTPVMGMDGTDILRSRRGKSTATSSMGSREQGFYIGHNPAIDPELQNIRERPKSKIPLKIDRFKRFVPKLANIEEIEDEGQSTPYFPQRFKGFSSQRLSPFLTTFSLGLPSSSRTQGVPRFSPKNLLPIEEILPLGEEWEKEFNTENADIIQSGEIRDVEFIGIIGLGGFSTVYEVKANYFVRKLKQWKRFNFALKVIKHKESTNEEILNSFQDYSSLLCLRHENICNMAAMCGFPDTQTGYPFSRVCVFLELCNGNLEDLINEAKSCEFGQPFGEDKWVLPINLTRHWFVQIARALVYIHQMGVIHWDIGMTNIFFISFSSPSDSYSDRFLKSTFKLGDFGNSEISKLPESLETHRKNCCEDIELFYYVFCESGVPIPAMSYTEYTNFARNCRSEHTPQQLDQTITADMIDLIGQMGTGPNRATAKDIMNHEWVQNSDDPRTKRFIIKSENYVEMVFDETTQTFVEPSNDQQIQVEEEEDSFDDECRHCRGL